MSKVEYHASGCQGYRSEVAEGSKPSTVQWCVVKCQGDCRQSELVAVCHPDKASEARAQLGYELIADSRHPNNGQVTVMPRQAYEQWGES